MKNRNNARKIVTVTLCLSLALGAPVTAHAVSVGGGWWTHSTDDTWTWSSYTHNSRTHMAWAANAFHRFESRAMPPTRHASVAARATLFGNRAGWGVY